MLVLSLFPGADLLGRGFESAGFCVVRGPDVVFGQCIESFHPPASHFTGVIGGPPCQDFSRARRRPPSGHGVRMLTEFARCVTEAAPDWFLCENVPGVPDLVIRGFTVQRFNITAAECGLAQSRNRAFQFGTRDGKKLVLRRTVSHFKKLVPTVMARDHRKCFAELCELQGLPRSFDLPGLSRSAKIRAVGNGVPVPMSRMVAEAIRDRELSHGRLCACACGREVTGRAVTATAACRKRIERSRRARHSTSAGGAGGEAEFLGALDFTHAEEGHDADPVRGFHAPAFAFVLDGPDGHAPAVGEFFLSQQFLSIDAHA